MQDCCGSFVVLEDMDNDMGVACLIRVGWRCFGERVQGGTTWWDSHHGLGHGHGCVCGRARFAEWVEWEAEAVDRVS